MPMSIYNFVVGGQQAGMHAYGSVWIKLGKQDNQIWIEINIHYKNIFCRMRGRRGENMHLHNIINIHNYRGWS